MADIKKEILKEMRNPQIYLQDVIDFVEKRIKYVFGVACENKISINEWQPDSHYIFLDKKGMKKGLNEKTTMLTVRMFDLWEAGIIYVLGNRLKKMGIKVEHSHTSEGDMIIIFPSGEKMIWEIKTSQAENSFSGATHSSSKSPNFILINYSINKNQKLKFEDNPNFITGLAVFVWDKMEGKFIGDKNG